MIARVYRSSPSLLFLAQFTMVRAAGVRLLAALGPATFVFPPEPLIPRIRWPREVLAAWPPYTQPVEPGTLVYIRGARRGQPRVARVRSIAESDADADDEMLVTYCDERYTARAKRHRVEVIRGRDGSRPAVLLCEETDSFRRLARSQVLPTDAVLEVGCSFGHATSLLAANAQTVHAVDVATKPLEAASLRCAAYSNVRFEVMDALREPERLVAAAQSATVVLLDINGNRPMSAVAPLVRLLLEKAPPQVTIVKCRALCRAANDHEARVRAETAAADVAAAEAAAGGAASGAAGPQGAVGLVSDDGQQPPSKPPPLRKQRPFQQQLERTVGPLLEPQTVEPACRVEGTMEQPMVEQPMVEQPGELCEGERFWEWMWRADGGGALEWETRAPRRLQAKRRGAAAPYLT